MNFVILTGRFVKDPEIRYTSKNTATASFALAVDDGKDKDGNRKTLFINCVAWSKTAELIDQYFVKGDPITVTGKVNPRFYEKDGQKRYITEIVVNGIEWQMGKKQQEPVSTGFDEIEDEGELPF